MEDQQLPSTLLSLLEEVAIEEGFRKPSVQMGAGTKPGDGFLGVVQRVLVEEKENGVQRPSLSLIVKSLPGKKSRRELYQSENFFVNEAAFYNEIIPAFRDFQKEKEITTDFAPAHPRCLRAGELLIMEDQNALGFIMKDRMETLDYAHSLLIMRELGRLHAVSFALRDQRPTLFKRLSGAVRPTLFIPGGLPAFKGYLNASAKRALKKLEERPQFSAPDKRKYVEAVRDYSVEFYEKVKSTLRSEDAEPYAVITHGDCWTNNVLFKYTQNGKEPDAVCFLDFQLSTFASPACDISYFIYCCTDKATRTAHYHQLLQQYHSSLATHLARLGSDVDRLFPMEALQGQMKRFAKLGLGLAMAYVPSFTCHSREMPDMDDACDGGVDKFVETFTFTHSNDDVCWERISDVIVDFVDQGYVV